MQYVTVDNQTLVNKKMTSKKNPWRQNSNLGFSCLGQFGDEVGVKEEYHQGECEYPFCDRLRAADRAAAFLRKERQQSSSLSLQNTPACQFITSAKIPKLVTLANDLQVHYNKYNNHSVLRHLEKEIHRRDANSFINMSPENRTSFYDTLTLAVKLSDEDFVKDFVDTRNNVEVHWKNSIAAAKSLLHDLYTLEDMIDEIASLHNNFVKHSHSIRELKA